MFTDEIHTNTLYIEFRFTDEIHTLTEIKLHIL